MSLRHLTKDERWYLITADRDEDNGRPNWLHRGVWLHGPKVTAHAEWNILGKHGFGLGWQFGRNGGESDVGLSIYVGWTPRKAKAALPASRFLRASTRARTPRRE